MCKISNCYTHNLPEQVGIEHPDLQKHLVRAKDEG